MTASFYNSILILILFLLLVLPNLCSAQPSPSLPTAPSNLTYGELAYFVVPFYWNYTLNLLPVLQPTVMPGDVKNVRKGILAVRNALDIFNFAYPTDGSPAFGGKDPVMYIRELLNEGYEGLGSRRVR
jgi:hypothetical protein